MQGRLQVLEEAAGVHTAFLDFGHGAFQKVSASHGIEWRRVLALALLAAGISPPYVGQGRHLRNDGRAHDQRDAQANAVEKVHGGTDGRQGQGSEDGGNVHGDLQRPVAHPLSACIGA
ncbi:hypothetical protein [Ottowia sp.]|uniref:hypothetical protein n=1 Tax=Ottowia sp. TaxID=1898956 RepID=UPI002600DAAD|nr:hypothetical protein [Ottowia sp.]MBK6613475.1 hypothetical protein [Ottowia sp.]